MTFATTRWEVSQREMPAISLLVPAGVNASIAGGGSAPARDQRARAWGSRVHGERLIG